LGINLLENWLVSQKDSEVRILVPAASQPLERPLPRPSGGGFGLWVCRKILDLTWDFGPIGNKDFGSIGNKSSKKLIGFFRKILKLGFWS
jgi:hypothetical protein